MVIVGWSTATRVVIQEISRNFRREISQNLC